MTRAVRFRQQAEAEFEEAQAWYEERSTGLGQAFVTSVQAAIERIRRNPGHFPRVEGKVQRALVRRFPYGIFYLADEDKIIVMAVFHASRDPDEWRSRV